MSGCARCANRDPRDRLDHGHIERTLAALARREPDPRHRSMLDLITARNLISGRLAGPWAEDWQDSGLDDAEAYLDWATEAEAEGSPSSPWDYVAWMTPGDWDWDAASSWYVGRHVADEIDG